MKMKLIIGLAILSIVSCQKQITYKLSDVPNDFVGLPPLPKDSGFQLHIAPFPIPANFEREVFIRQDLGNTEDIYVNKIHSLSRPGSHHFVLSTLQETPQFPLPPKDVMVDQNNLDGSFNLFSTVNRDFVMFVAQSADYELALPAGYAIKLPKDYKLLANPHYYNKTNETRWGEVYYNLHTIPKASVTNELYLDVFLTGNDNLILPPNKETVITTDKIYDTPVEINVMTPHYHKRGKKFEIQIIGGARNGEVVLESYDYIHPITGMYINKPIKLYKGEGLRSIVTYYLTLRKIKKRSA